MIRRARPRTHFGVNGPTALPNGFDYRARMATDGQWWVGLYCYHRWPKELITETLLGKSPDIFDVEAACLYLRGILDTTDYVWYTVEDGD